MATDAATNDSACEDVRKTGRDMAMAETAGRAQNGILGWIERSGNKLPDPVFLFFWLIAILVVVSVLASLAGLSAAHPTEIDPDTGAATVISPSTLTTRPGLLNLRI